MKQYSDFLLYLRHTLPEPKFHYLINTWGGQVVEIPANVTEEEDALEIRRELASWAYIEDLIDDFNNKVLQQISEDYGYPFTEILSIYKEVKQAARKV